MPSLTNDNWWNGFYLIACAVAATLMTGMLAVINPTGPASSLLLVGVIGPLAAIFWAHGLRYHRRFPILSLWQVMVVWHVALPVWLARRGRPLRGLVKGAVLVLLIYASYIVGWTIGYHVLSRRAYAAHLAGDLDAAILQYRKLLIVDPSDGWAQGNLATLEHHITFDR